MDTTNFNLRQVGQTIVSTAKSEAERFFKTELKDDPDYIRLVFPAINGQVRVALRLLGISYRDIVRNIDVVDYIYIAMVAAGFNAEEVKRVWKLMNTAFEILEHVLVEEEKRAAGL